MVSNRSDLGPHPDLIQETARLDDAPSPKCSRVIPEDRDPAYDENRVEDTMYYSDSSASEGEAREQDGMAVEKILPTSPLQTTPSTTVVRRAVAKKLISGPVFDSNGALKSDNTDLSPEEPHKYPLYITVPLCAVVSYATLKFALWFPYVLAPQAATDTYIPAGYHYDAENTQFDNSAWTWGTDCGLSAVFAYGAYKCLTATAPKGSKGGGNNAASLRLRLLSGALLTCYAVSTFAGALAHRYYTTLDSMNTLSFRVLWIVCVGNVSGAGGYIGAIGQEVARAFYSPKKSDNLMHMPVVPEWFWLGFGVYMVVTCILGDISFKRPACDIFIAGTSQFVPTVYCMAALFLRRWNHGSTKKEKKNSMDPSKGTNKDETAADRVRMVYRVMYHIGFIGNAPLLPAYPLLVQYTSLSLGAVNTILHTNLLMAWGMQAISLHHLCKALSCSNPTAVTKRGE